jgi:hypothetical protein
MRNKEYFKKPRTQLEIIKKHVILFVLLFFFTLMNAQEERYMDAKYALQKSEVIKAIPQESNGYLVMHKDSRVEHWVVMAMQEDEVYREYQTGRGENYIQIEQEIYTDLAFSYKIMGMSETGEAVLDIDVMPANGDPTWIYNVCNRPRCVKTSGQSNYAYGIEDCEHVSNDSYRLKLQKAWSHIDNGMRIPYYIEVSTNNLSAALANQNLTYANGVQSPQTYFWDNGMYKVALGMGVWQADIGEMTNQINGSGGEGCTLSFGSALNRMNASAQLSSTLTCTGQQYSQNQGGGGDSPYGIGNYANASQSILDCSALFSSTTWTISYSWEQVTGPDGIISNVLVLNLVSTNIALDCDETTTNPNSPCPPGYYYSPGGGDPCKPIEPILDELLKITMTPVDVELEGDSHGDTLEKGLYLMVLNYADGTSIPIYKKIENRVSLREDQAINTNRLMIFPNPIKDEFTLSLDKDEIIRSYSIFDNLGNEVKKGELPSSPNQHTLNLEGLSKGIYLLSVETDSNTYSKTIIKR